MIQLDHITKEISRKPVLSDISYHFKKGSTVLLKGHNGCGKTMLLRLLCGLIRPTAGNIQYDSSYRFGVIIENATFFLHETAQYNLQYLASINKLIGQETIDYHLKTFHLDSYKNKKVKTFSLGMKQRLALCQAFMESPDILLLDEPFNAIDDQNVAVVYQLINEYRAKGHLVVIASHGVLSDTCVVDHTIIMQNGSIIETE